MHTARHVLVVMIVVHIVTTTAAPGSVKKDKANASSAGQAPHFS